MRGRSAVLQRPRRLLDVGAAAARQRGDHRPAHFGGDLPGPFRIGRRGNRKARFDDVDAERVERPRQRQLRRHVHREAGRLLAVAERRVEDEDGRRVSAHDSPVVAAPRPRSQSDNHYAIIRHFYGPDRAADLSRGCRRAQLFARRRQGPPHPAGGQPGRPPAGGRPRRSAVRPVVEERHADRRRQGAAELRPAPDPPGRGKRIGDPRAARPAARPRADRRQRSCGAHAAAGDGALPAARPRHRRSTSGACRRVRLRSKCSRAASTSAR